MDNEIPPPPKPVPQELTPLQLVIQSIHLLKAAEVKLQPKPGPTAVQQFKNFIKNFRDNPVKNTMKLLAFPTLIALLVFVALTASREGRAIRTESLSYAAQTQTLDKVRTSLNSLLDFVSTQQNKLQESFGARQK